MAIAIHSYDEAWPPPIVWLYLADHCSRLALNSKLVACLKQLNSLVCPLSTNVLTVVQYMINYQDWRRRYVRPYEEGLYVAYNHEGNFIPPDAVTVSEASG